MEVHFGAVDETTKRLVGRCVRVPWLKEDPERAGGESAVAKKLLGVEMPGGMASSLSVVEVTTHKEKPGVLTGSREKEEEEEQEELDKARESKREVPQIANDGIRDHQGLSASVADITLQGKSPTELGGGP